MEQLKTLQQNQGGFVSIEDLNRLLQQSTGIQQPQQQKQTQLQPLQPLQTQQQTRPRQPFQNQQFRPQDGSMNQINQRKNQLPPQQQQFIPPNGFFQGSQVQFRQPSLNNQ